MDDALADLRYHWGSAYMILHPQPDVWLAQRRDDYQQLTAAKPLELLLAIREDYRQNPVPRLRRGRTRPRADGRPLRIAPDTR